MELAGPLRDVLLLLPLRLRPPRAETSLVEEVSHLHAAHPGTANILKKLQKMGVLRKKSWKRGIQIFNFQLLAIRQIFAGCIQ